MKARPAASMGNCGSSFPGCSAGIEALNGDRKADWRLCDRSMAQWRQTGDWKERSRALRSPRSTKMEGIFAASRPRNEAPASLRTWEGTSGSQAGASAGKSREISLAAQLTNLTGAQNEQMDAGRGTRRFPEGGHSSADPQAVNHSNNFRMNARQSTNLRHGRARNSKIQLKPENQYESA